jgi:hypothetical protein
MAIADEQAVPGTLVEAQHCLFAGGMINKVAAIPSPAAKQWHTRASSSPQYAT